MVACSKERPNDFKEVPIEPMLAQSVRIKLRPEQRSSVTFYTAAALNETELEELLKGLKSLDSRRESELAYAQAVARMNYYKIGANQARLAGKAIYNALKDVKAGSSETGKRDLLWSMGISGEHPIMLIHCPAQFSSESLKNAVNTYRYIMFFGL